MIEDGGRVLETGSARSGPGQPPRRALAVHFGQDAQRRAPRRAGGLSPKNGISGRPEGLTITQRLTLAGKLFGIRPHCKNSTSTIEKSLSACFNVFVVLRIIHFSRNMVQKIPSIFLFLLLQLLRVFVMFD